MIHILFGAAATGSFKLSLKEMEFDKKERVISFSDIFSIGPIWKLHKGIGVKSRFDWIRKCMNDEFGEYQTFTEDFNKVLHQISSIPDGEHVMMWASDSAHEQTGLRFVAYLLGEKNIDMTIVNTTKGYDKFFQAKKIKYTLLHTGEIPPEKFKEIYERGDGIFLTDHDKEQMESLGHMPNIINEVAFGDFIFGVVMSGMGITIVSEISAKHIDHQQLFALPITDFGKRRSISLVTKNAKLGQDFPIF